MSKQASPRLIGAFVLGGILLAVALLALVSSMRLFDDRQVFVMYFESSVNNLNIGAPVKWKGVPVGAVTDIRIRWNQDELSAEVPVFVEIDLDRLAVNLDDEGTLKREILNGMRAQLSVESYLSGLLFIELNYVPNPGPPRFVQREPIYGEIPTVPSPWSEVGEMATSVVEKFQSVDIERIATELTTVWNARTICWRTSMPPASAARSVRPQTPSARWWVRLKRWRCSRTRRRPPPSCARWPPT
jgi:paraquat-inducible protein B